jgi:type IV pilus assembly protein PilB
MRWYAHRGNIRYRLLRSGLGIILLIGLLSFGTGSYFWRIIDTATEIRNSTGNMLTQRSLARNAEKDFRLSGLLESEFYQGTTTQNLLKHHAAMSALENENVILDLEDLGLGGSDFDIVLRNILRPFGMVLITGPTGSGKTTSLYAMIMRLGAERQNALNISTIEDPVEYTMPRVNQVQINPVAGIEFTTGLRA